MARKRRLPRSIERELAKLCGTLGFEAYASLLWNLAATTDRPAQDGTFKAAYAAHILDQARFDPAVVSCGPDNLESLKRTFRNLERTIGISSDRMLEGLGERPTIAVVVGRVDEATVADLEGLLTKLTDVGAHSVMVVATEAGSLPAGWFDPRFRYIQWPGRSAAEAAASARQLALFLHVAGASAVLVLGSRLGFRMVAQHGAALAGFHTLLAVLDVPAEGFFRDVSILRATAPHATILARSRRDADSLNAAAIGLDGPGIVSLEPDGNGTDIVDAADRRTLASRTVFATLRGASPAQEHVTTREPDAADRDLTVVILLHRERELAVPALASLGRMVELARADGIAVEACALLDRPDAATDAIVAAHGAFLDDRCTVDLGSPAAARNAAAGRARGRFLAFLDGDDLWCSDWLTRGYRAAVAAPDAVWHPEALFTFYASDCEHSAAADMQSGFRVQQASDAAGFDRRDLMFENMWSANAIAATAIHRRFPYRADDWSRQIGIEDWRWNLDTLGHGVPHAIVADTVHLIRIKEGGSLGQLHEAKGLLPLLG